MRKDSILHRIRITRLIITRTVSVVVMATKSKINLNVMRLMILIRLIRLIRSNDLIIYSNGHAIYSSEDDSLLI
jgi:hypothetical protein